MTNKILLFCALVLSIVSLKAQDACPAPQGLFASARDSVASLNWQSTGTTRAYMVQWKSVRSTDWKTETSNSNTLIVKGLLPCSEYEFRVKTVCSITASSAYGESRHFKTSGCNNIAPCATPREVKGETGENKAVFKWVSTGARGYEVQYKDASNNGSWITAVAATNLFDVVNLKPCTKYSFRVRSICSNLTSTTPVLFSEWSSIITVATTGCGTNTRCKPVSRLYILPTSAGITVKWDVVLGATYDVQVKKITETQWRSINAVPNNYYAFTDLAPCTVFEVRVKVNCSATSSSSWSYPMRFKTSGCQPICIMPRGLKVIVADSVAVVSWSAYQSSKFVLQFKTESDSMWKSVNATSNVHVLTGLARCKKYVVRVQANCSSSNMSDFSEIVKFETGGCRTECATPRQLAARLVDSLNSGYLTWSVTGARAYIVEMKNLSDSTTGWRRDTVTNNVMKFENLARCSKYGFRVRAICNGIITQPSEIFTFETRGCPEVCAIPRELKSDIVEDSIAVLYWAGTVGKYEIQYRLASSTENDWKSVMVETPAHKLKLQGCKIYLWRVRKICSNGDSGWSEINKFETKGCIVRPICAAPINLKSEIVADTAAYLLWTSEAGKFEIQYRLSNLTDNDWKTVTVSALAHKLPLERCKDYYWRVRKICENGASDWSDLNKFETRGCIINPTCPIPAFKAALVTDTVAVAGWLSESSKIEIQYRVINPVSGEWVSMKFENTNEAKLILKACKVYEMRSRSICLNGLLSDWSPSIKLETKGCIAPPACEAPINLKSIVAQDTVAEVSWTGATSTKYEVQYRLSGSTDWKSMFTDVTNFRIIELKRCAVYEWRVRKYCSDNTVSPWSDSQKIVTLGCVNLCENATDLHIEVAQDTVAYLKFIVAGGGKIEVQYRVKGSGDAGWMSMTTDTAFMKLIRLKRCTIYEVKMRRYCPNGFSDWSTIRYFETRCITTNICPAPVVKAELINNTIAVTWSDILERDTVIVQYATGTDANYREAIGTTPNGVLLRDLQSCATYKIRVVRKCLNGGVSAAYETVIKVGGVNCFVGDENNMTMLQKRTPVKNIGISPNPGYDFVQVQYDLEEAADIQVQLLNLQGQVVKQLDGGTHEAGNYMQVLDNLNNIQQGMYFLVIRNNGKVTSTQKWMKQ